MVVSSEPLVLNRAARTSPPLVPAMTILPSHWMATSFADSPLEPKSVSSMPSALKRAAAGES